MIFSGRKGQNRVCVFTFNFARPSGEKESTETYYDRENYDVAEYVNIFLMFLKRMNLFLSFFCILRACNFKVDGHFYK